MRVFIY